MPNDKINEKAVELAKELYKTPKYPDKATYIDHVSKIANRICFPKVDQPSIEELTQTQVIANKWESFYFQNNPKITVADSIKLAIEEWNEKQPK